MRNPYNMLLRVECEDIGMVLDSLAGRAQLVSCTQAPADAAQQPAPPIRTRNRAVVPGLQIALEAMPASRRDIYRKFEQSGIPTSGAPRISEAIRRGLAEEQPRGFLRMTDAGKAFLRELQEGAARPGKRPGGETHHATVSLFKTA
jgi:hypothetical protein